MKVANQAGAFFHDGRLSPPLHKVELLQVSRYLSGNNLPQYYVTSGERYLVQEKEASFKNLAVQPGGEDSTYRKLLLQMGV
jgi:hypothetical protein